MYDEKWNKRKYKMFEIKCDHIWAEKNKKNTGSSGVKRYDVLGI